MPKVRRLHLGLHDEWGGVPPVGLEHLSALEQIHVNRSSSIHEYSMSRRSSRKPHRCTQDVLPSVGPI
jgi:predicted SprT family Zn-dependent metalloprotease